MANYEIAEGEEIGGESSQSSLAVRFPEGKMKTELAYMCRFSSGFMWYRSDVSAGLYDTRFKRKVHLVWMWR